ncbi:MAG: ABC transporter ATP-binding protein [Desulfobacteria bacterium]|nr:ABC transporter ATP-binding protein [Deltaproteobacteria bacterium]
MNVLEVQGISASYEDTRVLWDISFTVKKGRLVALLGANGAGKTTTLKSICGLVRSFAGSVRYNGQVISGLPVHKVVEMGITLVPEGRQLFPKMTVEENLLAGSYLKKAKGKRKENLDRAYAVFPRLAERRTQMAETLSGGEQQMVAIGRGLMQSPDLIMFDEPSLGLSPLLVEEVFRVVRALHDQGLTIFLVEQNVRQAMKIADYCYVMENGRIVQEGSGRDLESDPKVREAYLGY